MRIMSTLWRETRRRRFTKASLQRLEQLGQLLAWPVVMLGDGQLKGVFKDWPGVGGAIEGDE